VLPQTGNMRSGDIEQSLDTVASIKYKISLKRCVKRVSFDVQEGTCFNESNYLSSHMNVVNIRRTGMLEQTKNEKSTEIKTGNHQ